MSEPTLEWLKTLCDEERAAIAEPFTVTFDNQTLVGASNGQAMTLVRIEGDAPHFAIGQKVVDQLATAVWQSLPFAQVEAWAMRQNERCEECGGIGFIARPDLTAFDAEGLGPEAGLWQQCFECRWTERIGTILGVRLDRFLLLRYLGPLTALDVDAAAVEDTTLALRAPGWIVLIKACVGDDPGEIFEVRP